MPARYGGPLCQVIPLVRWWCRLAAVAAGCPLTAAMAQIHRVEGESSHRAEQVRVERLATLGDLWGKLYLFHPNVGRPDLDWQRVLVDAIPAVERAESKEAFAAALNAHLFAPLRDPGTFARIATESPKEPDYLGPHAPPEIRRLAPGVGYLGVRDPLTTTDRGFLELVARQIRELEPLTLLVVDLRWTKNLASGGGSAVLGLGSWLRLFVDSTVSIGAYVNRRYLGWQERGVPPCTLSASPCSWGVASQWTWNVSAAYQLAPARDPDEAFRALYPSTPFDSLRSVRVPAVFLVNNASFGHFEAILDHLQATNRAAIVWERTGPIYDASRPAMRYAEEIEVRLNTRMLRSSTGSLGPHLDSVVTEPIPDASLPGLAAAVWAGRQDDVASRGRPFTFHVRAETPDSLRRSVSREEKLFGFFKVFAVLDNLFPFPKATTRLEWATLLRDWIPEVERTVDLRSYYSVLRRLSSRLDVGHVSVSGHPDARRWDQPASIAAKTAKVDGHVIITEVKSGDPDAAGLSVGAEILAVNGESVTEIERRLRDVVSSPEPFDSRLWAPSIPLYGQRGTPVELTLVDRHGRRRQTVVRNVDDIQSAFDTALTKRLPRRVGYISLLNVRTAEVLYEALRDMDTSTVGLVLDLRGYPRNGAVWDGLIARLIDRPVLLASGEQTPTAEMSDGIVQRGLIGRGGYQLLPHDGGGYHRPVAVLINELAISYPEAVAERFKDCGCVTLVGTPTGGAASVPTSILLPGGARFVFPEGRTRWRGVPPDVPVSQTIAGVREGRDELLEAGVRVVLQKAAAATRRVPASRRRRLRRLTSAWSGRTPRPPLREVAAAP